MSEANRSLTGPATPTKLPHITLRGNSYQRGCQYGRDFREYLGRFYDWFIGRDPKEVLTREYRTVLEGMEEVTSRQMPQLLEELKGWSDGSGLEYNRCRLLGFHNEIKSVLRPGCSNVIVTRGPDGPWLAKNTDLFENERSWMVMVTCNCDDAFSHAGVNYLGLPFGGTVNSAGLVIGGSSLPADPPAEPKGFPNLNHYMTLTQSTVAGCWDAIR